LVDPQPQRFGTCIDKGARQLGSLFWWAATANVAGKEGGRFGLAVRATPNATFS
jgi:hypothetical protein